MCRFYLLVIGISIIFILFINRSLEHYTQTVHRFQINSYPTLITDYSFPISILISTLLKKCEFTKLYNLAGKSQRKKKTTFSTDHPTCNRKNVSQMFMTFSGFSMMITSSKEFIVFCMKFVNELLMRVTFNYHNNKEKTPNIMQLKTKLHTQLFDVFVWYFVVASQSIFLHFQLFTFLLFSIQ